MIKVTRHTDGGDVRHGEYESWDEAIDALDGWVQEDYDDESDTSKSATFGITGEDEVTGEVKAFVSDYVSYWEDQPSEHVHRLDSFGRCECGWVEEG